MIEENERTDPAIELRLDLGYSNQYEEKLLIDDSGAGANAGSMVDMVFVTTDPLSELVWSPDKGLSLKCADFSFADRKPSMLRGVGPSNMSFERPPSVTAESSYSDKLVQDRISTLDSKNDCDSKDVSAGLDVGNNDASIIRTSDRGIGDDAKEMNNADEASPCFRQEEEDLHDSVGKEMAASINTQLVEAAEMMENKSLSLAGHDVNKGKADEALAEKDELELDMVGLENPVNLTREDSDAGCDKRKMGIDEALAEPRSPGSLPQNQDHAGSRALEKRESTAENEFQNINDENGCRGQSKVEALELLPHQPFEKLQSVGESVAFAVDNSPSNSRIHKKRKKGEKKDLSDGQVDGSNSNNKDDIDSYESVESCNSGGRSSRGKKRWNEQELVVESKRVKNQIHCTSGSTSFKRQDSSFMNWISNMMKGLPKSIPENESSPFLTHVHSADELNGSNNERFLWKKKSLDIKHQKTGFPSIFHSLSGLRTKGQQGLTNDACFEKEERPDDCIIEAYDANATPLAFHRENLTESVPGNGAGVSRWPKMLLVDHSGSHENLMTLSGERKVTCNPMLTIGKDKYETSSSSSMPKHMRNSTGNIDSDLPSEVKTSPSLGNTDDHLKSLWITRLSTKTSRRSVNLDLEEQNINDPENHVDCSSEQKKQPESALKADPGCSASVVRIEGHDDQSLAHKFNPMLPSPRFKSSEAMASVFARRLDALKHIPSNIREIGSDDRMTCFFCGSRDHHLQNCSKIAESEVEHLSKISSSCDFSSDVSSLCIRCFQLNHWAVSCPLAVSRAQYNREPGCSDHFRNVERQHSGSGLNPKFLVGNSSKGNEHNLGSKPGHSEISKQVGKIEDSEENFMALSRMDKKEGETVPDVGVVFDMIKKLRLSRTDILKWMNSDMSLSKLEGLFLRLRLGKWEKGLGGTGYHVAFVTATQNARNSISVNVGGVECLAKSQYISNHDFLEDELRAWWRAALKDRSRVVVEADLEAKVQKKRLLGL